MRIYVIRHGQRADRSDEEYTGSGSPPLSEVGHRQAELLGRYLAANEELNALYSSAVLRALQTAQPVQAHTGAPWHVWPVFAETPTRYWDEVLERWPERANEFVAWPVETPVPTLSEEELAEHEGYELLSRLADVYPGVQLTQPFPWPDAWWLALRGHTRETGYARLEMGIRGVIARHDHEERVAVVCHGNAGDMLVTALMDMPRRQPRRFTFHNTGVTRVDIREDGQARIAYANWLDHLPPELRV